MHAFVYIRRHSHARANNGDVLVDSIKTLGDLILWRCLSWFIYDQDCIVNVALLNILVAISHGFHGLEFSHPTISVR